MLRQGNLFDFRSFETFYSSDEKHWETRLGRYDIRVFAFYSPILVYMEIAAKLEILADAAKYDASCASSGAVRKTAPGGIGNSTGMGICHSYTPDGRCVSLLKILLTRSEERRVGKE